MLEDPNATVPAYTLFDAEIGYAFENWSVAVNARNLADTECIANCGWGNRYCGEPRQVMATVNHRW